MPRLLKDIPIESTVTPTDLILAVDPVTGQGANLALGTVLAAASTNNSETSDITRAAITARKRFSGQAAAGSEFDNVFADLHGSVTGAHTFEIKSGIPTRFASNANHSHAKFYVTNPAGPALGSAASRAQLLYNADTDGKSAFILHGYGPELGLVDVANEDSLDTTGTNATLTGAPNYQGVIKIRYTAAPTLALNQLVIFQVFSAVAGIQATLFGGKVTQLPTLVSGKYEILVQISGLDPNHWTPANAGNVDNLDGNWVLRTLTGAEVGAANKVSLARDTTGPTDQLTITWNAAHGLSLGQSVVVWADVGISGITGLPVGNFNSGHVVEVTSANVAKVRIRNNRLQFLWSFSGTTTTPAQWAVYPGTRDPHHEPLPPHNALTAWRDSAGRTRRMALGGSDVLPSADQSAAFGFDLPPVTRPKTIRIGVFDQFLDVLDGMASRSIASLITAQTNGLAFEGTSAPQVQSTLTGHPIGTGDVTIWNRIRVPNNPPPAGQFNFIAFLTEGAHRVGCYIATGTGALTTTVDNGSGSNLDFVSVADFVTNYAGQVVDIHLVRKGTVIETYLNGTLYNTTTNAKAAADFTEAAVLRVGSSASTSTFIGRLHKLTLFNRAIPAREIQEMIDFDVNVDERQGSPNNIITNTGFETNTAGYVTAALGVASLTRITSDFNSGSACAEFSGTVAGDSFVTDIGSTPQGVRYRVTFWAKLVSGNANITVSRGNGANPVPVTLTSSWAKYVVETDKLSGANTNYVRWNLTGATVFRIDDIRVEQLGTVVDLDCGVGAGILIPDRSQNKLHALASGSVRHLISARRGQVRAKITATGQVLPGGGSSLIPANCRITSIVANVVGSGTLSLGTASGGTQFVNAASVSAGLNDLTVGTRLNATAAALWATVAGITSAEIILSYEMVDL